MQKHEEDFVVINTRLDLPVALHEGYKALWEDSIDALIATSDHKERAFHEHLYPFSSFVRQRIKYLLLEISQNGKTNNTQRRCAEQGTRENEEASATCERAG